MTEQKPGFIAQIKSYPAAFWVANTMEIFERLSWYGWFTVMALYVTAPPETGGLGFTTETRGNLQGIVPFFLYLMPVITGAMADRFGFKRMFIIAYAVMIVSYYLLGQFTSLPTFFMAFMFVAVGAAIFKPVVVGTVARVTDDSNSATGFGIFYMMVNIGGFVGPIVAGAVRGWSWDYVFIACSFWAFINLLIVLLFYKEPPVPGGAVAVQKQSILQTAAEVLGNFRFVITVALLLIALMLAGLGFAWFGWTACLLCSVIWLAANFIYDLTLPKGTDRPWLFQRMRCSNWRFAVFLLIMSGFWTSFNQIFITMPEYIRDFTETRPLISAFESVFGESDPENPDNGIASKVATINAEERNTILLTLDGLLDDHKSGRIEDKALESWTRKLSGTGVVVSSDRLQTLLDESDGDAAVISAGLAGDDATSPAIPPALREALVATIQQLKDAFVNAGADEEAQQAVLLEFAEKLWNQDLRLPIPSIEELARQGDDAGKTADQAVEKYREVLVEQLAELHARDRLGLTVLQIGSHELLASKVRLSPTELETMIADANGDEQALTNTAMIHGRQFNPEFIININAGSIVLFQVLVSFLMARFHRFTTMIVGMVVAAVGIGLSAIAGAEGMLLAGGSIWIVALGLMTFSFGEMMASPTSQEYVGRIAPGDKKALYMGYYFVAIALGNLFGGILSGQMYGTLARDMQRPDIMWTVFGAIMLGTAVIFMLYNKFALPKEAAHELMGNNG
ncbi:MAG: MFS transporter [bacterium]|nr:MFS transporter [bacterium]